MKAILLCAASLVFPLALPASGSAHAGHGTAFANCLLRYPSSWVETYTPANIPVLNRTRFRDRQTIYYYARAYWYGRVNGEWGFWYAPETSEVFSTTVAERRGRRRTTDYWSRGGDVRRWGTRWRTGMDTSTGIEITLIWHQGGRQVHLDRYYVPSFNYQTAPYGNRYWTKYCYQWNGGYSLYPYGYSPRERTTVYWVEGRRARAAGPRSAAPVG